MFDARLEADRMEEKNERVPEIIECTDSNSELKREIAPVMRPNRSV